MSAPALRAMTQAGGVASATRDAALALLLRRGECTAAELSSDLGVSVQIMRRHLRGMEEEGLVESSSSTEGPGRPSNHWRLTSIGQSRFPDGSQHFALGLMESLAGSLPAEAVQELLAQQARQKANAYREHIGTGPLEQRVHGWWSCAAVRGMWPSVNPTPVRTPEAGC